MSSAIGRTRLVQLNPFQIARPVAVGTKVAPDGLGLPAELNQLKTTRYKVFAEIENQFRSFFPWVEEIEVPALPGSQGKESLVSLSFRESGAAQPYPAKEMASGMLLALALLWIILHPRDEQIICYDEPENSIHPYLLERVYELLKMAANGKLGRRAMQVVIATHSVDFVNLCSPDEIRLCERSERGVIVHSVDKSSLPEALDSYRGAMGELWYSGALGGVPDAAQGSRTR